MDYHPPPPPPNKKIGKKRKIIIISLLPSTFSILQALNASFQHLGIWRLHIILEFPGRSQTSVAATPQIPGHLQFTNYARRGATLAQMYTHMDTAVATTDSDPHFIYIHVETNNLQDTKQLEFIQKASYPISHVLSRFQDSAQFRGLLWGCHSLQAS